ncbi:MAG: inorganic phosphate transporter [Gemmataceae bacterium]|nr:inorganic phosphate transporter [Gemmataceae bacterium]
MTTGIILFVAAVLLASANGANDNFKGVATLFGSGTANYRRALLWATGTTLLGSLLAVWLAQGLLSRFSGKGLVPDPVAAEPRFLAAVALGAGGTVLAATRLGLPVSTTHGLVGAMVGAGVASGSLLNWASLGSHFFAPLLFSPLAALAGTLLLYPVFRWGRGRLGVTKQTCFCIGVEPVQFVPLLSPCTAAARAEHLTATFGTTVTCQERYAGRLLGLNAAWTLDGLHYLSAGLVSLARGLNDTPKIAALLLALPWVGPFGALAACGVVIALGGLAGARRVAETMSHRITPMNAGQGFTANVVTGLLVVLASRWGWPVSTTHVSCGSLYGLGMVTGEARWELIGRIVLAWLTTLPLAGLVGCLAYLLLNHL